MQIYFTLVSTVFNEIKRIDQTISDLEKQLLHPSEIIVTDAGSTDGTYERLIDWKNNSNISITILRKHKCNVAEGRNIAIRSAKYDLIVSMDFGCRFKPEWLAAMVKPFQDTTVKVVGGGFEIIEKDQVTTAAKAAYVMTNGYSLEMDSPRFIPSSRSIAYKSDVFMQVGGYCEWLTLAGDDMVFGMCIRSLDIDIFKVKEKFVSWDRHQKAKGYIKESERYGLGEGEAKIYFIGFIKSIIVLLTIPLFFLLTTFNLASLILFSKFNILLLIANIGCLVGFKSILNIFLYWRKMRSNKYDVKTLFFSFYLQQAVKYGYAKGYLKGRFFSSTIINDKSTMLHKTFNI
jgi:glycosyltransferase involved in cell wall biosynthesis